MSRPHSVALDTRRIWYSAANEDSGSDRAALQLAGKTALCITASGGRVLDLLLDNPASIRAIDLNPAQTAFAELMAAAYASLDQATFEGFIGLAPFAARATVLAGLTPRLSLPSQDFWRGNAHLAERGLLYCGRWESYLRLMRDWAGRRRRAIAARLLNAPSIPAQYDIWKSEWDDRAWRTLLRVLALRPLWSTLLREPGLRFVPKSFDVSAYVYQRFDHAARTLPFSQLPFLWLLFTGTYPENIRPPYLMRANFQIIRTRLSRMRFETCSLHAWLRNAQPSCIDAASLSDYSSYANAAAQAEVWSELGRVIAPGGRVCERKFFNKSGLELPAAHGFKRLNAIEQKLDAEDGALFYSFVVAEKL